MLLKFFEKDTQMSTELEQLDDRDMYKKWGRGIMKSGWTSVPNILLKNAANLKLDPTETLTLVYLIRFWWKAEDHPFPSISKTSKEMGVTRKTLSKKFASLKEKGLILEIKQPGKATKYSLSGLLVKLNEIENVAEMQRSESDDIF